MATANSIFSVVPFPHLDQFQNLAKAPRLPVDWFNSVDSALDTIQTKLGGTVYVVATLPTGPKGMRAFVSDANTATFNAVVGGGAGNNVPVFYDGTTWRVG